MRGWDNDTSRATLRDDACIVLTQKAARYRPGVGCGKGPEPSERVGPEQCQSAYPRKELLPQRMGGENETRRYLNSKHLGFFYALKAKISPNISIWSRNKNSNDLWFLANYLYIYTRLYPSMLHWFLVWVLDNLEILLTMANLCYAYNGLSHS